MDAFKEGAKDFRSGQISNPYEVNTRKNKDWEMGFNKAYFSNKERQIKYEQERQKEAS